MSLIKSTIYQCSVSFANHFFKTLHFACLQATLSVEREKHQQKQICLLEGRGPTYVILFLNDYNS